MTEHADQDPRSKIELGEDEELVRADDTIISTAFRWSVLVIVVGGLVAAGAVYLGRRTAKVAPPEAAPLVQPQAQERGGDPPAVVFRDITRQAGIDFEHTNGARGGKYLPETMGGGCAFFDHDGDGDQDLLLVNSCAWPWDQIAGAEQPTMAFYDNDATGAFTEVTAAVGLDVSFYGMGAAVGDYDNDGDVDLFITAVGGNHLFENRSGRFVEVTAAAGVAGADDAWSAGAAFFDYDRDGDLDLFVANYVHWSRQVDEQINFQLIGVGRAYGPPHNFEGSQPYFYRNNGDGTFTELAEKIGLHVKNPATGVAVGKGLALAPCDIDEDGWMDIVVANDTVANFLYHNQRDGTFSEIGELAGVAYSGHGTATGAMGADSAHHRNDAALAFGIGNFANEMTSLYVSQGDPLLYADESITEGIGSVSRLMLTFGLFFFDYDLDGRLDLLQANGHIEDQINLVQPSQHYRQPAQLFWNCGFDRATCLVPVDGATAGDLAQPLVGRGAAYADIDADGDLDVLLTQTGGRPLLLRNEQTLNHHWLRLVLRGNGTTSNRDAIGARVELSVGATRQYRQVMPTRSYLAQVELPVTFGLGTADRIDRLTVIWPDGTIQDLTDVAVDRPVIVEQP